MNFFHLATLIHLHPPPPYHVATTVATLLTAQRRGRGDDQIFLLSSRFKYKGNRKLRGQYNKMREQKVVKV
jgi:hypothetical protein